MLGRPRKCGPGRVLRVLAEYEKENGFPPTLEELRIALGVGSKRTALRYLRELEDMGCITRWPGARGIRIHGSRPGLSGGAAWPGGVSDGLTLRCHDCGDLPRFDYRVDDAFWRKWVPGPERTSVVCLPCLDQRCRGEGLADALQEIQWTGTGHTVVCRPEFRFEYAELRGPKEGFAEP